VFYLYRDFLRGNVRGEGASDKRRRERAAALALGMSDPVQELNKCRPKHLLGLKRTDTDDVCKGERIDLLDKEAHVRSGRLIGLADQSRVGCVQKADILIVCAAPLGIARHDARKVPSACGRPVDVVVARRQDALHYWRRWRRRRSADESEALEHSDLLLGHLLLQVDEIERKRHLVGVLKELLLGQGTYC